MKYNTFKSGIAGSMLALAFLTSAFPAPRAEAATLSELQAQIQSLLAQIDALKGGSSSMSNTQSCNPFSIDLTLGRSGTDVTALQNFLIKRGHAIPAGATGYFGEQTRSALAQFQAQNGIIPAIGYFGPQTRGKVNALCATQPNIPNNGTGGGGGTQTNTGGNLHGEASFENFDALSGDDTNLEEGQKNAPVMDVTFDIKDGDARINRVDLGFTPDTGNDEKKPWKTFNEISIYKGNQQIGKIDASNKANWKENNPTTGSYLLRMSGINWVTKEGDTAKFTVKATTAGSIKGTNNGEMWNVFVPTNGIRGMDAESVSVYAGDTADFVTVAIDESGSDDELMIKRSDADIDATTLELKDDARSGFIKVFAFDLDTGDSANDIEIRKLPVNLTVSSGTVGTFLRDAQITINGKTYTKKTIVDGTTNTMTFDFGSGELVIPGGDRTTATLEVDFKQLSDGNEGTTIVGSVDTAGIVAEGSDDLGTNQISGSATGETHTLRTKGIIGEAGALGSTVTSVDGATNDYATFSTQVNVTALGQDVYIPVAVNDAVTYQLENSSGSPLSDTGTAIFTSNARQEGGYYRIEEGDTKTVTLEVTYRPGVTMTTARLQLLTIAFNGTASAPTQTWSAVPQSNYETATKTIVD